MLTLVHIHWTGKGWLVAAVTFGSSLAMELVSEHAMHDDTFFQKSIWALPLALLIAGFISLVLGLWLNAPRVNEEVLRIPGPDERMNGSHALHTMFFIRMEWWGLILVVLACAVAIYRSVCPVG